MEENLKIEMKEWIKIDDAGIMTITDKSGKEYKFKEVANSVYKTSKKKAEKLNIDITDLLIKESLVDKLSDEEMDDIPTSTILRFEYAMTILYGLEDFQ
ncbi:MAG: hypothetical protein PHT02_11680 [Tissierellia bacterium]|nr:hypothetical protein [Tissierellia bacterium]